MSDESYRIIGESDEDSLWLDISTPPLNSGNVARHLPIILRLMELPLSTNGEWQRRFGLNLIETTVSMEDETEAFIRFRFDWDFSDAVEVSERIAESAVRVIREAGELVDAVV